MVINEKERKKLTDQQLDVSLKPIKVGLIIETNHRLTLTGRASLAQSAIKHRTVNLTSSGLEMISL